jgi:hypothetical protein
MFRRFGDRRLSWLRLGLVLSAWVGCSPGLADPSTCFSPRDNGRLTFAVIQQAPPPAPGAAYPAYPFSDIATMQLGQIDSGVAGSHEYYAQWANRSDQAVTSADGRRLPDRKANLQPRTLGTRTLRTRFTSVDQANLCTFAQTSAVLGMPMDRLRSQAQTIGVTLRAEPEVPDAAGTAQENLCVLPNGRLPLGAAGIMLDYEVQDGRTPPQTAAFLAAYADLVHKSGRKVGLLLNPLDAPTQRLTGVSKSNAAVIARRYDWSTILLWASNKQGDLRASFAAQMALLQAGGGVDPKRLVIDFELANTTLADAATVRSLILANHLKGVMFWRNGAKQGGACSQPVNRKIACVAFGECSP